MASILQNSDSLLQFALQQQAAQAQSAEPPRVPSLVHELFERFEREPSEPAREQIATQLFGMLAAVAGAQATWQAPESRPWRC